MAVNKYNKDYRLVEDFRANGKVKVTYEYIGRPWYFSCGTETVGTDKKKALLLVLVAGAAFVASLIPFSQAMHRLWVALPYAFSVLPIFLTGDLTVSMQGWKEPLEHRQADKLNNRYPAVTLAMTYLAFVSLVADGIFLIVNAVRGGSLTTGDVVLPCCMAVILTCGARLFRLRKRFAAAEK